MKAITIWQPWASLIACGAKKYETRGWATNYRGPIAIHAGKKDAADLMSSEQIDAAMRSFAGTRYEAPHTRANGGSDYVYPYGCVIATAELVGCWKTYRLENGNYGVRKQIPLMHGRHGYDTIEMSELEELFGDFTAGRFAWELTNVKMLPEAVPAKGRQGLWNWEGCNETTDRA